MSFFFFKSAAIITWISVHRAFVVGTFLRLVNLLFLRRENFVFIDCFIGMMRFRIENRCSYEVKILSGISSFRRNMKWARKAFCTAITDFTVLTTNNDNKTFQRSVQIKGCPVGWGCRIHRLHLCRGLRPPPPTSVLDMTLKQSDGEVLAMLERWGMQSNLSLASLPSPLWPRVVAPDRALSMG